MIQFLQLILSLSILVFIHELGHFLAARLFKMRVDKFYLFFNPWFSLYKKKIGETEYGIGWLPLGGYVKIAGMIDESMDKEQMKNPPQPWEFRAKPAWQRFIVMVAGVIFNFILAIFIYTGIVFTWGEEYIPAKEVNQIMTDSVGYAIGLQTGDKILAVNGKMPERFGAIIQELILSEPHQLTVLRGNDTITITLDGKKMETILQHSNLLISPRLPSVIGQLLDTGYALKAGLKPGDRIIAADTLEVEYFDQLSSIIPKYKNKTIPLKIVRNNDTLQIKVQVPSYGKIGIYPDGNLENYISVKSEKYTLTQSFLKGISMSWQSVKNMLKQLKLLATPKTGAYKSVGSFISIGKMFDKTGDWHRFWALTAFLSIMLAVLNLLPIPALDGGHALLALWEIITGKKPTDKFIEITQVIGMILLFAIIILAFWNDIAKYILKLK